MFSENVGDISRFVGDFSVVNLISWGILLDCTEEDRTDPSTCVLYFR